MPQTSLRIHAILILTFRAEEVLQSIRQESHPVQGDQTRARNGRSSFSNYKHGNSDFNIIVLKPSFVPLLFAQ